MDEILDILTPTVTTTTCPAWVPLTEIERHALAVSTIRAHATRCPTLNEADNRFVAGQIHARTMIDALGHDCKSYTDSGAVNALWTRQGQTLALALKTQQFRLCRRLGGRRDQSKTKRATLAIHNTIGNGTGNGNGNGNGKAPRAYDYCLCSGLEMQKGWGMDIAIIPRTSIDPHSTVDSGQVKYVFDPQHCVEYLVYNQQETLQLWQTHIGDISPEDLQVRMDEIAKTELTRCYRAILDQARIKPY